MKKKPTHFKQSCLDYILISDSLSNVRHVVENFNIKPGCRSKMVLKWLTANTCTSVHLLNVHGLRKYNHG